MRFFAEIGVVVWEFNLFIEYNCRQPPTTEYIWRILLALLGKKLEIRNTLVHNPSLWNQDHTTSTVNLVIVFFGTSVLGTDA